MVTFPPSYEFDPADDPTHPAVLNVGQAVTADRAGTCGRVQTRNGTVPCWPGDLIVEDGAGGYKVMGAGGIETVPNA